MVSYFEVKTSNVETLASLPDHLVALFVGATNGIGEYTLKEFAKHARSPRVYFIAHEAGTRIAAECKTLNDGGSFTFIQADTSLVRNVDNLCDDIRSKESAINILFISTGTLDFNTSELIYLNWLDPPDISQKHPRDFLWQLRLFTFPEPVSSTIYYQNCAQPHHSAVW